MADLFDWRSACMDAEHRFIEMHRVAVKLATVLSSRPPWQGTPVEEIVKIFREAVRDDVDAG